MTSSTLSESPGKLKAIETVYNGYRFRSRLEARWAVFFDSLNVEYQYEPEGFDLDGTWYLPDFHLPNQGYWLEIKPRINNSDSWHIVFDYTAKMMESGENPFEGIFTPCNFFLIEGDPWVEKDGYGFFEFSYDITILGDHDYRWCECPDCGRIELQFAGRSDRMECKECISCRSLADLGWDAETPEENQSHRWRKYPVSGCQRHGWNYQYGCRRYGGNLDKGYNPGSKRLLKAYSDARQARFEFGESG